MKILNFKNYFICLSITIVLLILRTYDPFFIETARLKSFDYYQRGQEKVKADSVCIVEIDENSLDKYGQWPWPRNIIADSVVKAYESGAALVVLPILYAEEDRFKQDEYLIDISNEEENNTLEQHYFLNGGVYYDIGTNYQLIPSVMLKKIGATPVQMDLNLRAIYDRFLWAGVSYRTQDAISMLFGLDYANYSFGYSYDITVSSARSAAPGSHEISASIEWCVKSRRGWKRLSCPDF